jgi:phage gp36-like protein
VYCPLSRLVPDYLDQAVYNRLIDAPESPSVTGTTSGSIDIGPHNYRITFLVGSAEYPLGLPSATVNHVGIGIGAIRSTHLSNIPIGGVGVTSRKIYRNKVAAQDGWFLLYEIPNNTATTYDDTTADASLGAANTNDPFTNIAAKVDGTIDGFLAQAGYTVPLTTVPALIEWIAAWMERYHLYSRRSMVDAVTYATWKQIMGIGQENQPGLLQQIAEGDISIGLTPSTPGATACCTSSATADEMELQRNKESVSTTDVDAAFPIGGM